MKFLVVVLFLGLAAAEHAWAPGKVFTYKHKHEVKLGYPAVAAPLAAPELTCDVKIQPVTAERAIVQLAGIRQPPHNSELAKELQQPFAANIKGGVIKTLEVSPALPVEGTNIVKAKMSALNLNLLGLALYDAKPVLKTAVPNAEKTFFTVYEETHFGLCQASYAISPLPAHLATCKDECMEVSSDIKAAAAEHLLVTKIVDAHKCQAAAAVAHVMPPVAKTQPYAPAMNAMYTKLHTTQYIIHGDRTNFLVKDIKHVEKIAINPLRGETAKILLETVSSWKLAGVSPASNAAPKLPFTPKIVKSVVSDLVPQEAAAYASVTESGTKKILPIHKSTAAIVTKVVALLTEITTDVEAAYVDPEQKVVSDKVMALESALSFLDLPELVAAYEKVCTTFSGPKLVAAKAFLLDAAAICGTNPCVALIKKLVVEGKVPVEQAAVIIMTLPMTIKTPTPAVIRELLEMVHVLKTVSETLYTTALLACSNIVYHHCVKPTYMKTMGPTFAAAAATGIKFCDTQTPEVLEFITRVETELKVSTKAAIKVAAIKALANTAHPLAVEKLKPYVFGAAGDEFLRIQAITSLNRAAECNQESAVDMLMGVFVNLKQAPTVRIAAASVVLATHPHLGNLAKLAVTTWYEPSVHVHTFIYTALTCLSMAKLPVDPMVNHEAKAALALCKPYPALAPFSFHAIYADYMREFNVGAVAGASVIGSGTSLVPKFIHKFFVAMEGYPQKKLEASFAAEGIEAALLSSLGKHNVEKVMDVVSSIHPKLRSQWKDTVSKYMVQDKYEAEPVKAAAWFRIHDAIEAAFTLEGADGLVETVVAYAVKAAAALKAGVPINVHKTIPLVDTWVVIPTELGYPAAVRVVVPCTLSVTGSIKATMGGKPTVEAVLKPLLSASYHAKATVFGFPTESVAEAGIIAHAQVAVPPCKFAAAVDPVAKAAEFKIVPAAAAGPAKIFHVHVTPYTAYEPFANVINPVTAYPTFKTIKRAAAIEEVIAPKYVKAVTGLAAYIEHATDTPLASLHQIKATLLKHYTSPLSIATFPYYLVENVINYQKLNVAVDFAASPVKEFKFVTSYYATVAQEVSDSWSSKDGQSKIAPVSGMFSDMWSTSSGSSQQSDSTYLCLQTQKPYGSQLTGAKVHNIKLVASCVGPATALVYEHTVAAAVTPDFKLAHLKYVLAAPAIPTVTPAPYKVIFETTVANHLSQIDANSQAQFGQSTSTPQKLQTKAKVHKSKYVIAEETRSGIKQFDSLSLKLSHSSGKLPAPVHQVIKAAEHLLTFVFYPYMSAEYPAQIAPGKFAVDVVVNPAYGICSIFVKKEAENIAFTGIPIPAYIAPVFPIAANLKGIQQLLTKVDKFTGGLIKATCYVDSEKVVTFDGVKVAAAAIPVGKEVLLTKYAGVANPAVVSMTKKAGGVMVVKVAKAGQVIEVQTSAAGVAGVKHTVTVNGMDHTISYHGGVVPVTAGGAVVAKIVKVAGGVEIICPIYTLSKDVISSAAKQFSKVIDISQIYKPTAVEIADKIVVAGGTVAVKVTPISRGKMVGICGNYNGETYDDLDTTKSTKKVQKSNDYSQYYKSDKSQSKKTDDSIYMESASKKIEKFFSKFTME